MVTGHLLNFISAKQPAAFYSFILRGTPLEGCLNALLNEKQKAYPNWNTYLSWSNSKEMCLCVYLHAPLEEFHGQWGARGASQRGSGSQLRCGDGKLLHKRQEQCPRWTVTGQGRAMLGKKAEVLTSNFPIGFQGRLPAHNDSARLPFPGNDCQIFGSRGRGCEMRQRQGLVIGCERKQTSVRLLIMMVTLSTYHEVYHVYFATYNLFQGFELNKQTGI